MEFEDIKQWLVEDKQARPVNQQPGYDFWDSHFDKQDWEKEEGFSLKHTYATNAPDGIHSAEMFEETVWQVKTIINRDWRYLGIYETIDTITKLGRETRRFLPFKLPLEYKISTINGVTTYSPAHPEMNTVGRGIVNPNANAIKVIQAEMVSLNQKLDNKYLYGSSGEALNIEYTLERFRHILKLLQS